MRYLVLLSAAVLMLASLGCSAVKKISKVDRVIGQDIALEDQDMLLRKYTDRKAWTRSVLEHLTERTQPGEPRKKVVPRDTKVEIADLSFSYSGAVTVIDHKKRRIVHGLNIGHPLTVEKIEEKLNEIFWFDSPMMRHVAYIRKWGKRTARAVRNHEVFIGMPREAAIESWGVPTQINTSDIAGREEEQWVYKRAKKPKYIYILDGKVSKWEE